ncbi:unnamed protein product [Acanthoscelides obtectus]|uniref:Uncharacterized protein n=1 Tax=Acanthoscelides obtectus TaxID=200917 RepID=A0A9P0PGE6_ACAOB|nr:unnamed protein product [Acanthoscelides obtectus]CAK1641854.1 hypothetical protein AOBTE_LOCUS12681 [Acanthoscelides obtectus]
MNGCCSLRFPEDKWLDRSSDSPSMILRSSIMLDSKHLQDDGAALYNKIPHSFKQLPLAEHLNTSRGVTSLFQKFGCHWRFEQQQTGSEGAAELRMVSDSRAAHYRMVLTDDNSS